MKSNKKIESIKAKNNVQYCKCGHSITFMARTEYLICHHCGRKVINKTKGHFKYKMYGLLNVSDRKR